MAAWASASPLSDGSCSFTAGPSASRARARTRGPRSASGCRLLTTHLIHGSGEGVGNAARSDPVRGQSRLSGSFRWPPQAAGDDKGEDDDLDAISGRVRPLAPDHVDDI